MRYVHVNKTDRKILNRIISDARRPHELAGYPEFGDLSRQYINTRLIRMAELQWIENRSDGLYAITKYGRRKFADLEPLQDDEVDHLTEVNDMARFFHIYGPDTLAVLLTWVDKYHEALETADGDPDMVLLKIEDQHDVAKDHAEFAMDELVRRVVNQDKTGADPTEWIASRNELDGPDVEPVEA